jgi:ABC-type multidrug transport system fused ATPase/permease subunit
MNAAANEPMTTRIPAPLTTWRFMRFLYGAPFFTMIALIFVEAVLGATVTYFVIQAGKDIAADDFKVIDFAWILAAQAGSYLLHGVSWIYGERAGFAAYAKYMVQFTRDNRHHTALLAAKDVRETVEPFLTSETFHLFFELMYELESTLQLFFGLLLSALVIGFEIDQGFPIAYAAIFAIVMILQYCVRKPVSAVYLNNQKATNRMSAATYNAWDNIYAGNRYNFHLWLKRFKERLRAALRAQINAILLREGISSIAGILGLIIIFGTMALVVSKGGNELGLLVALAATLPKQIDMTHEVHSLAIGWNDLLALWTRAQGVVAHMRPTLADDEGKPLPSSSIESRIKHSKLKLTQGTSTLHSESLSDVLAFVQSQPTGRINVRGENGAGKSTLLLALKQSLRGQAYYWPTADRLAFDYAANEPLPDDEDEDENAAANEASATHSTPKKRGYSSGEQQLAALKEIVQSTRAPLYLLDEWDANLDAKNRVKAWALIDQLAARARVVEISHRDQT